jgi:hypothetical protein
MNVCEVAPRLAQFEAPLDAVVRGYNVVNLTGCAGTSWSRPAQLHIRWALGIGADFS